MVLLFNPGLVSDGDCLGDVGCLPEGAYIIDCYCNVFPVGWM